MYCRLRGIPNTTEYAVITTEYAVSYHNTSNVLIKTITSFSKDTRADFLTRVAGGPNLAIF